MTATLSRTELTRADVDKALTDRLSELLAERQEALAEIVPGGVGDDADRATNVDGHVRLAMIDKRIVEVQAEIAESEYAKPRVADGTATAGDIVTVDFGDGPEQYLLGSVEQARPGVDVITTGSPLGLALLGTTPGTTIDYSPRPHRTQTVTLVAIS